MEIERWCLHYSEWCANLLDSSNRVIHLIISTPAAKQNVCI